MKDLKEMTSKELKEVAKGMGVKNWWNLKKSELIIEIEKLQNSSDEEKAAAIENEEREKAAVNEYTKNWKKYTKRYNVGEFLEGWRSGKIVLESEETENVEEVEETEEIEEVQSEQLEDAESDNIQDEPQAQNNISEEQPTEKPTPKRGALIEFDGKAQNICAWGEELGISPNTLYGRIYKMGWSVEKAFTTPSRGSKKNK